MAIYMYNKETGEVEEVEEVKKEEKETLNFILKGIGFPGKDLKRKEWIRKNPGGTTDPYYKKKIDKNSEKAKEMKAQNASPNLTEI